MITSMIITNKMVFKINWFVEQNYGVENLSWWVILIIAIGILVVIGVLPWKKIYHRITSKSTKKEVLTLETKVEEQKEKDNQPEKDSRNTPYWGVYNWFGKKQALRTTKWVYVQEQEDSCPLCRPFENQVLSLEKYAENATTMREAISQGYHHLGCHHLDLDYFHGVTKVPTKNQWTKEHKQMRYHLRLKQYKLEQTMRDLKYKLENKNLKVSTEDKLRTQIKTKETELMIFVQKNNLIRQETRENPDISDWKKFS